MHIVPCSALLARERNRVGMRKFGNIIETSSSRSWVRLELE